MLERIVGKALRLPPPRRERYLRRLAMRWPELAREAAREVEILSGLGRFLEPGPAGGMTSLLGPGDRVGDFRVVAFHARGAWGEVYRAEHHRFGLGPVALKVAPTGATASPAAEATAGLRVPHLVEVHAAGHDAGRGLDYVAMRFVAGVSLADVLEDLAAGRRPADGPARRRLVERLAEVAGALAVLHVRGLVHLDVKPANVLLEGGPSQRDLSGPAVLVDLGLLRPAGAASPQSTVYATLPYAAPEQVLGLDVDGRTDVFALGVTLHDLLACRTPEQRGRRPAAGLEPLRALVPGLDPELEAVVAEAVEPDRERRYATASALAADLRAWSAGAPVSVRPRSPLRRARRMLRRQPRRFAWSAALALAAALAVLYVTSLAYTGIRDRTLVGRAAQRLAAGDLPAALEAEAGISSLGRRLWASPLDAWRTGETGEVLRLALEADPAEALRHAARLLARDGLEAHPVLARWLVRSAAAEDGGGDGGVPPSTRAEAARLLTLLLLERPVEALPESPLEAELRAALADAAAAGGDPPVLMHLVAALGGWLGTEAAGAIVALLERTAGLSSPERDELARVAAAALWRTAARSCAETACSEAMGAALPVLLARAAAAAARHPATARACRRPLEDLFALLAAYHRRLGLDPPDPACLQPLGEPSQEVRAAVRHPDFLAWLASFQPACQHSEHPGCLEASQVGWLLAFAGEDRDPAGWWGRMERALLDGGCDPLRALQGLEWGHASARAVLEPGARAWTPDEGSRLRDWFDVRGLSFTPLPLTGDEDGGEETAWATTPTLAAWDFTAGAVRPSGAALAAEGRAVRFEPDDVDSGQTFLWLGAPGESALRLSFATAPRDEPLLRLRVWLQKAQRPALPHSGRAGVTVTLDGRPAASIADLGPPTAQHLTLPLGRVPNEPAIRTLELRLAPGATTTVRVYEVAIE